MANRYWIGGSGTWNATTPTSWSASSGGAGGASAPTASDNVIFDANSGTGTITCSGTPACLDLDMSGTSILTVSGTANINVYGNITLKSGMTWNRGFNLESKSTGKTITTGGNSFSGSDWNFEGIGGGWILQDALTITGINNLNLFAGTLDTNGQTVTISSGQFGTSGSDNKRLRLGNSTITVNTVDLSKGTNKTINLNTATINCIAFYGDSILNPDTSTINCTDGNGSFNLGGETGLTFFIVNFTGATNTGGANFVDFHGTNTFDTLSISSKVTIKIDAGTTQTLTTFSAIGTAGNIITLSSQTAGSAFTLSKPTGIVTSNYLSLKDRTATGGATWLAGSNSTNVSGNSGWQFIDATTTSTSSTSSSTTSTSSSTSSTSSSTTSTSSSTSTSSTSTTRTSTTTTIDLYLSLSLA